jgi:hypothetical protein
VDDAHLSFRPTPEPVKNENSVICSTLESPVARGVLIMSLLDVLRCQGFREGVACCLDAAGVCAVAATCRTGRSFVSSLSEAAWKRVARNSLGSAGSGVDALELVRGVTWATALRHAYKLIKVPWSTALRSPSLIGRASCYVLFLEDGTALGDIFDMNDFGKPS